MRITISQPPALNLAGLTDEVKREMLLTMQAGTRLVLNDGNQSIARGPKTGKIYNRRGVEHQASAPGEPPATDTGGLIASGRAGAEINGDEIVGVVEWTAPHAQHLEYGTRKMAARPFANPAIERNRARIASLLRQALATATARFAKKR